MVCGEQRPVRAAAARQFSPSLFLADRRGTSARDDAVAALAKLAGQPEELRLTATLGDAFMFQEYYRDREFELSWERNLVRNSRLPSGGWRQGRGEDPSSPGLAGISCSSTR